MDPTIAIKSGIQVIYQDFSLFPNLTVAENIVLTSAVAGRRRLHSARAARPAAQAIVDDLGLNLDLDADVEQLSVADKQLTAICRALVSDARVLIMDEPTTALTHTEVDRLFVIVERLRAKGVGLIFVSHKLDEVLKISQRVAILRSGKNVVTGPASNMDPGTIALHMTGRELDETRHVSQLDPASEVVLELEGLGLQGAYKDVSFSLRRGEILGVTGLLGSGRTEIAESLFGAVPHDSGTVKSQRQRGTDPLYQGRDRGGHRICPRRPPDPRASSWTSRLLTTSSPAPRTSTRRGWEPWICAP